MNSDPDSAFFTDVKQIKNWVDQIGWMVNNPGTKPGVVLDNLVHMSKALENTIQLGTVELQQVHTVSVVDFVCPKCETALNLTLDVSAKKE